MLVAKMDWKDLRMCELGNQHLREDPVFGSHTIAKNFFQSLGVFHVSIDINGRDGALPINLCKLVKDELAESFDVVTNFGTSEHVEDQAICFQNIYRLCRDGGLSIHMVPATDNWKGHGLTSYDFDSFKSLAAGNKIMDLRLFNALGPGYDLIAATIRKSK